MDSVPSANISYLTGSLCQPLKETDPKFDLVHGNVPNLICNNKKDLSSGSNKGTFVKESILNEAIPEDYLKWGLGTQYLYLKQASEILNKGGSVVTILGGRFPLEILSKLLNDCNLTLMPEFSTGFKWQTQPRPDYKGYAELEKKYGISFDFYLFDEAKKIMADKKIQNPTPYYNGKNLKNLFSDIRVSANQALELNKKGIKCGHTVHMIRGLKI
jgi:hypothetical protein